MCQEGSITSRVVGNESMIYLSNKLQSNKRLVSLAFLTFFLTSSTTRSMEVFLTVFVHTASNRFLFVLFPCYSFGTRRKRSGEKIRATIGSRRNATRENNFRSAFQPEELRAASRFLVFFSLHTFFMIVSNPGGN